MTSDSSLWRRSRIGPQRLAQGDDRVHRLFARQLVVGDNHEEVHDEVPHQLLLVVHVMHDDPRDPLEEDAPVVDVG